MISLFCFQDYCSSTCEGFSSHSLLANNAACFQYLRTFFSSHLAINLLSQRCECSTVYSKACNSYRVKQLSPSISHWKPIHTFRRLIFQQELLAFSRLSLGFIPLQRRWKDDSMEVLKSLASCPSPIICVWWKGVGPNLAAQIVNGPLVFGDGTDPARHKHWIHFFKLSSWAN